MPPQATFNEDGPSARGALRRPDWAAEVRGTASEPVVPSTTNVVVLEPDHLPASSPTTGKKADVDTGAKVTVKSERVAPNV